MKTNLGIALFAFASIAGCSSPNDATEENMLNALQKGIPEENCTELGGQWDGDLFVAHEKQCESLEKMVSAGILQVTPYKVGFGYHYRYEPTKEHRSDFFYGKKGFQYGNDVYYCPGEPKATEIISFTTPAEGNGMLTSVVTFKWQSEVPDVVRQLYDEGVFKRSYTTLCDGWNPFHEEVALEGSGKMRVVLTNNGWEPMPSIRP